MTQSSYNAKDIEVLNGLEPVRRRIRMYTDTTRPNHLAQRVNNNNGRGACGTRRRSMSFMKINLSKLSITGEECRSIFTLNQSLSYQLILAHLTRRKDSLIKLSIFWRVAWCKGSLLLTPSQSVLITVRRDGKFTKCFENGDKVEELHEIGTCTNETQERVYIFGLMALILMFLVFRLSLSHVLLSQSGTVPRC